MRNLDAPKRLPQFPRYTANERTARNNLSRAKKRRIFSTAIFVSVLLGTCLFLSRAVLSDVIGLKPDTGLAFNAEARIKEAEAKTRTAGNKISVTGVGRVMDDTAQGKLLGRRAAITDARRKLLIQRQQLLGDPRFQTNHGTTNVSGFLTGTQKINSEGVRNGIYFIEIEMRLSELLHSKFDEDRFAGELEDL